MNRDLLEKYYLHEAILERIDYNKDINQITMNVKYCEWQLEENLGKNISIYNITLYDVNDISNYDIFEYRNEYILDIIFRKNNETTICLDLDGYIDITFKYKEIKIEDILNENSEMRCV